MSRPRGAKSPASEKRIASIGPKGRSATSSSRRELNKQRRRRQILHGARACFESREIEAVSMDEIAQRAQVARGTLFNYFPSKGDIVKALVADTVEGFCRIIEEMNARHATVGARVDAIFGETAERILATSEVSRRILRPHHPQWGSALDDLDSANHVIDVFARTLATATDSAAVRSDATARDLAEIAISVFSGIVGLWRLDPAYPLRRKVRLAGRLITELARGQAAPQHRRRA